jgi:hypothetical protein
MAVNIFFPWGRPSERETWTGISFPDFRTAESSTNPVSVVVSFGEV